MCLSNGRLSVTATWETAAANGAANVEKLTNDTGYLWFFTASNVEVVIKVLDGCGLNSRYWVFAGGLTDVRTVITVRDLKTGVAKTYASNPGRAVSNRSRTPTLSRPAPERGSQQFGSKASAPVAGSVDAAGMVILRASSASTSIGARVAGQVLRRNA